MLQKVGLDFQYKDGLLTQYLLKEVDKNRVQDILPMLELLHYNVTAAARPTLHMASYFLPAPLSPGLEIPLDRCGEYFLGVPLLINRSDWIEPPSVGLARNGMSFFFLYRMEDAGDFIQEYLPGFHEEVLQTWI